MAGEGLAEAARDPQDVGVEHEDDDLRDAAAQHGETHALAQDFDRVVETLLEGEDGGFAVLDLGDHTTGAWWVDKQNVSFLIIFVCWIGLQPCQRLEPDS
jgi:hypothetical protein